jgi:hypothetical protein
MFTRGVAVGRFALTIAIGVLVTSMSSASADTTACSGPEFRQFDFWVGDWDVVDEKGNTAGRNSITLEQNGCAVIERWTSAKGRTGFSLNHFDPLSATWKQHWVGLGLILEMSGGMQGTSMVLEGKLQYLADSRVTLLRGTWTPLPDGRVRQHFVESADQGKTWSPWFDGYYSKRAVQP